MSRETKPAIFMGSVTFFLSWGRGPGAGLARLLLKEALCWDPGEGVFSELGVGWGGGGVQLHIQLGGSFAYQPSWDSGSVAGLGHPLSLSESSFP